MGVRLKVGKLLICFVLIVGMIPLISFSTQKAVKKPSNKVVVLAYHCVNDDIYGSNDYLFVSPSEFEKQMQYLQDNQYTVIPLDKINDAEKVLSPVVITFDDGYEDNYTYAYPILKKYDFQATVFIISALLDRPLFFKKEMLKESSDVFSFQSHTVSHKKMTDLSPKDLRYELMESQKAIYALTGKEVTALAYPGGTFNKKVEKEAKKYYKMILTVNKGFFKKGDSLTQIPRISIKRSDTIEDFKKKLKNQ